MPASPSLNPVGALVLRLGRQQRLIVDAVVLGAAGAVTAQIFTLLLRGASWLLLESLAGYRPPGLPDEGGVLQEMVGPHGLWLVPLVAAGGGLLVGILVQHLAPETEGHGTDTVVQAFHRAEGVIRARVPPVKLLASALTIGSGGAAGREGPIAQTAAGIGSVYATLTGRAGADRRRLLLVGTAAGLAAIFRSPIGAALFAIEVLYADMEFESTALLPAMLASVIAYALNGFFVGWRPLFRVPTELTLVNATDNLWYLVLGIGAGIVATVVPELFYGVRDAFRSLRIRPELKPALGGLLLGGLALVWPQVIGGGYGWMQEAIDGRLATATLVALVFAKPVAMSLTVSSGGSGGVFAPTLFIGSMLGGLLAALAHQPAAPFVIVGMAAVFAGAAHVPVATLMMVTEMTGGYTLLVPAALAVMISYLVQRRLAGRLRYQSLYEAQVATRADSPAHHAEHLKIALRILKERRVLDSAGVGELDLLSLLRAGIPVELPDGGRLVIGVLRADSPYREQPLSAVDGRLGEDTRIFAIIRGEHMLAPRPDTVLQKGDRLMLLTTAATLVGLQQHFDKW
ncbi:MAG TPA: chloride channel protein [Gemmatimonadales bacterium]|nr:chloride channel protein [Gemmatimonadales bacterium]